MLNNAISTKAKFNECVNADGPVKPVYQPLMKNMEGLGVEELQRRWEKAKGYANQDAFTFFLDPREFRTVPTDWFPRLNPAAHWETISQGVAQRLLVRPDAQPLPSDRNACRIQRTPARLYLLQKPNVASQRHQVLPLDRVAWSETDSEGSGPWRTTGSGGALDTHTIVRNVILNYGARVDNHIWYKADHKFLPDWADLNFPGVPTRHYLE